MGRVATGSPLNGIVEIAGPEQFRLNEFIRQGLSARNDPREVVADSNGRYFGAQLNERTLVPDRDAQFGETYFKDWLESSITPAPPVNTKPDASSESVALKENEFRIREVPPGAAMRVGDVAVFNVAGSFFATQALCTHRQGELSKGKLDGSTVTCPKHGAQFNIISGEVLRGPAEDPLQTYAVIVAGDVGRVEPTAVSIAMAV